MRHDRFEQAATQLQAIINTPGLGTYQRIQVNNRAGWVQLFQGDVPAARHYFDRAHAAYAHAGADADGFEDYPLLTDGSAHNHANQKRQNLGTMRCCERSAIASG